MLRDNNIRRNTDKLKEMFTSQYFEEHGVTDSVKERGKTRRVEKPRNFHESESPGRKVTCKLRSDSLRKRKYSSLLRAYDVGCCIWAQHPDYDGWWPASVVEANASGVIVLWNDPGDDEPQLFVSYDSVVPRASGATSSPAWLKDRTALSKHSRSVEIENHCLQEEAINSRQAPCEIDLSKSCSYPSPMHWFPIRMLFFVSAPAILSLPSFRPCPILSHSFCLFV